MIRPFSTVATLLAAFILPAHAFAAPAPLIVATGPVAAFAFPLGGEICRLYEKVKDDKAHCTAAATDGSMENLNRLRSGDVALALVQSDLVADAVTASGPFAGGPPFAELRSLVGFYPQALTILVRADGAVKQIDDLKGQRVAVGAPGQPEPVFSDFIEGLGWSKADLGGIVEMARQDQVPALCSGKIAAIAFTAPHPNGFVREALQACHLTMLDLAGPGLDAAVAAHTAYAPAKLDLATYGDNRAIQSFGPRAVLVTTAKLDSDAATRLMAGVFGHVEDLRKSHPAFATLDTSAIANAAGLGADRHPAATKYLTDNKISEAPSGE
jgi:TRAP transporter TAXI family solute receptor